MMKLLLIIGWLFTSCLGYGQDSLGVKDAMSRLENALLSKDREVLESVLHKDASFGHSNGWAQSKMEVLDDARSGKLSYHKFASRNIHFVAINKKWATVRLDTDAEGNLKGSDFKLNLHVMQVWIRTKKGWQLFARQSTKL